MPSLSAPKPLQVVTIDKNELPRFAQEASPPVERLYLLGNADLLHKPAIGLVGSRRASQQGLADAQWFAKTLVGHGLTIVSGLAIGIDGAAHRGALAQSKASTIAVLAHGLDQVYPSQHRQLAQTILDEGGLLVSEYPIGTPPQPFQFLHRNRIIALLSRAICLIEAADGSGALTTALAAVSLGRDVFVVPGSVHSGLHGGGHHMIRQGAGLVQSPEELLSDLGLVAPVRTQRRSGRSRSETPSTTKTSHRGEQLSLAGCEDPRGQQLWPLLQMDGQAVSVLAHRSGLSEANAMAGLLMLELAGLARRQPNGLWVRMRPI
ncbi:MAG: DNA-processing protein DprA [Burkholderiaceae bacterium]